MKFRIPALFTSRWRRWLDRRIPERDSLTLTQREIFIFLSRQGVLFLAVTLLILIASFNYQNNMGLLLSFTLFSLGLLIMFATFRNVRGITLSAHNAAPVFAGALAQFSVQITASDRDCESIGIGLSRDIQQWVSVNAAGFNSVMVAVPAPKRGVLMLPRLYLCSYFPLGWFRSWSWPRLNAHCMVYPQPVEPDFQLPRHGHAGDEGDDFERGSDDFYEHRPYRPGDSPRQIDWKVLARERGLLVRQFITPVGGECHFRLRDLPPADIELKLCWLSYLLCAAEREGLMYSLQLDERPQAVAQGDRHLANCLEALARY